MSLAPALLFATGMVAALPGSAHRAAEAARLRIIAACHIAADRLVVGNDGDPSLDVVSLKGSDPLSPAQLGCFADRLTDGGADVALSIEDERVNKAYDRMRRHRMVTSARADLRRRGLLDRVPHFDRRHETLRAFAVRLERLCEARPHTVLRVVDGWITIRDDPPAHQTGPQLRRWFCVTNAAILSGHDPITVVAPPPVPSIVVY